MDVRIVFLLIIGVCGERNNVCKNYADYFFINSSPNCWYNPEVIGDVPTVLEKRGYPMETYNITTKDGYILTMFRMPQKNPKEVVVLQPPMTGTSASFVKSGNASLAYIFYEAGYDVWLANMRGTYYSHRHVNLTDNDYEYWNFSFHEMGIYDLPAQFEVMQKVTKRNDLIFVAYSMGCNAGAIYASLFPKEAEKYLKLMVFIGPTIYTYLQKLPLGYETNMDRMSKITKMMKVGSIFPTFSTASTLSNLFCDVHPYKWGCTLGSIHVAGGTIENFDPSLAPVLYHNMPTRISYKVMYHFEQLRQSRRFQHYDYGIVGNLVRYNNIEPPIYPLGAITIPTYIITGTSDTWAPKENVAQVYKELSPQAKIYGNYTIPTYNHIDFLYAKTSREKIGMHILNLIENRLKKK